MREATSPRQVTTRRTPDEEGGDEASADDVEGAEASNPEATGPGAAVDATTEAAWAGARKEIDPNEGEGGGEEVEEGGAREGAFASEGAGKEDCNGEGGGGGTDAVSVAEEEGDEADADDAEVVTSSIPADHAVTAFAPSIPRPARPVVAAARPAAAPVRAVVAPSDFSLRNDQ